RIGCARFGDDRRFAIHEVLPRAAVPMVVPYEPQDAGAQFVECYVVRVVDLTNEMGGVGVFVAAGPVERAPHVTADTNSQIGPVVPGCDRANAKGNLRWFRRWVSWFVGRCNRARNDKPKHKKNDVIQSAGLHSSMP